MSSLMSQEKVLKLRSLYKKHFKVALFIYHVLIIKEEVLKLRSVYIKCLKVALFISCVEHQRRNCEVAESLYELKVLKLRCLYITCRSPKKKF